MMFILDIERENLTRMCAGIFGNRAITGMEVGVLRGENAQMIADTFSLNEFYLIDSWSKDAFEDYRHINKCRRWVRPLKFFSPYFGGDVDDQTTLDRLYVETVNRFQGSNNILIKRMSSFEAVERLGTQLAGKIDFLYLDGSHQFETVFDDLVGFSPMISTDGFLQMNDVAVSQEGIQQNLGVLEALSRFVKVSDFTVIAITNRDCADCLLGRRNSRSLSLFRRYLDSVGLRFVEVPDSLVSCARVTGSTKSISFC